MTVFAFQHPTDAHDVSRVRVEGGMFFADIILDSNSDPVVYIVILQQYGSPLVRGISRHASMNEAQRSALADLNRLMARAA